MAATAWKNAIACQRLTAAEPAGRRVLFVTNMWPEESRPYYGSFIASQARSLTARGVDVDVLSVRGYLGVRAYARAMLALPRVSRRAPYDLVHVHYGHTALAAIGVPKRPLVVSYCGGDLLGEPRARGITRKSRAEVAVFRQLARLATRTITKSAEMEMALPRALRRRNHVLPNGVDLEIFAPRPRAQARAELGWEGDLKTVLFLGNPEDPRKNVTLAREAVALLNQTEPKAELKTAWGVAADRVPVYLNAADCLVFPSLSEGSPNLVKEAMACALPIVSTPVGDVPERLGGIEGCFVREPEPRAFAAALAVAIEIGRAPAARKAIETLGLGQIAARLMAIYEEAGDRLRSAGVGGESR
jgi:glycosyltransferase involved in cell wall biosynthesis